MLSAFLLMLSPALYTSLHHLSLIILPVFFCADVRNDTTTRVIKKGGKNQIQGMSLANVTSAWTMISRSSQPGVGTLHAQIASVTT